ncbi:TIR domain-containing protein [Amycolatopsis sp. lyj-346]|uniref:TIR domain-containing protein n=1 Tax=Amycolatopsis sp. lyj-346 TaxID=2789289 RepID=UPI00397CC843
MDYYHIRVTVSDNRRDEVKLDLTLDDLEKNFLAGYRSTAGVMLNGRHYKPDQIERVRISKSDRPSAELIVEAKRESRSSNVAVISGVSIEWRAAARGVDVTDQFITGPPGEGTFLVAPSAASSSGGQIVESSENADSVFLIYGRDSEASNAVKDFLRSLSLRIIEWEHAVVRVGLPNPYVGDVVEAGLRMAAVAVVLLTPDDVVALRSDLIREDDGPDEREFRGQPRPNVIYEAGIADAIGRERTVFVEMGLVKPFSDISGRLVVRFDGSAPSRHTFAGRLHVAGLNVDNSGTDWLSRGDVGRAIQVSASMVGKYNGLSARVETRIEAESE